MQDSSVSVAIPSYPFYRRVMESGSVTRNDEKELEQDITKRIIEQANSIIDEGSYEHINYAKIEKLCEEEAGKMVVHWRALLLKEYQATNESFYGWCWGQYFRSNSANEIRDEIEKTHQSKSLLGKLFDLSYFAGQAVDFNITPMFNLTLKGTKWYDAMFGYCYDYMLNQFQENLYVKKTFIESLGRL